MVSMIPLCCTRSRGGAPHSRLAVAVLLLPLLAHSLLLAVAAAPVEQASQASDAVVILGVREQCGGLLWSGFLKSGNGVDAPYPNVQCSKGLKCQRDSKWFYECVPETDTHTAWKLDAVLSAQAPTKDMAQVERENSQDKSSDGVVGDKDVLDVMDAVLHMKSAAHHASLGDYWNKMISAFSKDGKDEGTDGDARVKAQKEMLQEFMDAAKVLNDGAVPSNAGAAAQHTAVQELQLAQTLSNWSKRKLTAEPSDEDLNAAVGIYPGLTNEYAQCGGKINAPEGEAFDRVWKNSTGSEYQCWPGWHCARVNEWYWQCQPNPTCQGSGDNTIVVDGKTKVVLEPWSQCGGKGGQVPDNEQPTDGPYPSYACFANTDCRRQNQWYWQCLPNENFGPFGTNGGSTGSGSVSCKPPSPPSPSGGNASPPPPPSSPGSGYYPGGYPPPPSGGPAGYPSGYSASTPPLYSGFPAGFGEGPPAAYVGAYLSPPTYVGAYSSAPTGRRRLTLADLMVEVREGASSHGEASDYNDINPQDTGKMEGMARRLRPNLRGFF